MLTSNPDTPPISQTPRHSCLSTRSGSTFRKIIMLVVFGLVLVVAGAFSQTPSRCVSPPQMEFRAVKIDHLKNTITRYEVVYDATEKRVAYVEEDDAFSPGRQFHAYIYLHNKNTMYDINLSTKECTKKRIDSPFHEFAIPRNATFMSDVTIGGPGEELFAQAWSDRLQDRQVWLGVFSLNSCFPIKDHRFGDGTTSEASSTDFYDVIAGISDPNAFIPPPQCDV